MKNLFNLRMLTMLFASLILSSGLVSADDFTDAMKNASDNLKSAVDKYDEKEIIKARNQFERILQLKKDQWLVNYYMAYADYNLALTGFGDGSNMDVEKIKKYTRSGLEKIQESIDMKDDFADAYVLQVFLNFNRWNYEQDLMNEIIAATTQALSRSEALEANNPRLHLVKGISSFYTPDAFGGGVKVAIPQLEKSAELFAARKESNELYPTWGTDMAYAYLALSMLKRADDGDREKAKSYIDTGLQINPNSTMLSKYVMTEYEKAGK